MTLPSVILQPVMVGARGLAIVLTPIAWIQRQAGSKEPLSERLRRWGLMLPGATLPQQIAIVIAVALGIVVAPILLLLGAIAVVVNKEQTR